MGYYTELDGIKVEGGEKGRGLNYRAYKLLRSKEDIDARLPENRGGRWKP